MPLKRTLKRIVRALQRRLQRASRAVRFGGFRHHGECLLAASGCYSFDAQENNELIARSKGLCHADDQAEGDERAFAQILGKLHFLQLFENLWRILVDYGKNHLCPANAAFNAGC
jgi:hypothetical protein